MRWVLTWVMSTGQRTLVYPAQGRYTYETKDEAIAHARELKPGLSRHWRPPKPSNGPARPRPG